MTNFIFLVITILFFVLLIGEAQRDNPCHRLANHPELCNNGNHPKGM